MSRRARLESPGRRDHMLNCAYRDTGVGFLGQLNNRQFTYWTQVFGIS